MSLGAAEELRFYLNLVKNTVLGPRYDLGRIPGPPGMWLVGHIPHLLRPDYHVQALEWANKYGGVCRFSLGGQYVVLVSNPAVVATLLGRGPGSLPRKCIGYAHFDLATNHLGRRSFFTTTDEEHWARLRKGTAAAFSQANIRRYFTCALKHAQELATHVKLASKAAGGGGGKASHGAAAGVEMQEQVEMMLLDVFLEGLFEVDLRRVNSEEVGHAMNVVLAEANERVKFPLRKAFVTLVAPRWSYRVWRAQRTLGALYERIHDAIRSRGVPPADETVLWACLARLKDPSTGRPLSREQLLPEIGAFILAGFDTSSHTIAWCLFNVAAHPEVQRKVKSELSAAGLLHAGQGNCVTPRQLSYEDLPRLAYLNAVIDEAMRLFPVAATGTVRETTAPTKVGAYTLPAGIVVWPMIYALQTSAHNWGADAGEFKPDRWLDNRDCAYAPQQPASGDAPPPPPPLPPQQQGGSTGGAEPPAGADNNGNGNGSGNGNGDAAAAGQPRRLRRFAPFSDGLKSCLGQALGLMEVRTVLAVLLGRFWFELAPSMGKPDAVRRSQTIALTLKLKDGLRLVATPHTELNDGGASGGASSSSGSSSARSKAGSSASGKRGGGGGGSRTAAAAAAAPAGEVVN